MKLYGGLLSWTVPRRFFFCGSVLLFVFYVCLSCCLVCSLRFMVTCWERAEFIALLYVVFSCVFVTVPYSVQGHVLYFIASGPDLCFQEKTDD